MQRDPADQHFALAPTPAASSLPIDTRALQHYLGHKNNQHTVRYTELSPARFRDLLEGLIGMSRSRAAMP